MCNCLENQMCDGCSDFFTALNESEVVYAYADKYMYTRIDKENAIDIYNDFKQYDYHLSFFYGGDQILRLNK